MVKTDKVCEIELLDAREYSLEDFTNFNKYLDGILSSDRLESITQISDKKDYYLSSLFIKNFLSKNNIPIKSLVRVNGQKPYVKNSRLHFSISHSNSVGVFVYDDKPVGIDIQQMKPFDYSLIANKYLSDQEYQYVMSQKDSLFAFYEIWCCKEALIKAIDKDSYKSLSELEIKINKNQWTAFIEGHLWYFYSIKYQDFMIVVCTYSKINDLQTILLSL